MSQSDPDVMSAILHTKYSQSDGVEIGEAPKPTPTSGQVLIKIHAASMNSWDLDVLRGSPFITRLDAGLFGPKRSILGGDVAGVVDAVGQGVTDFKVGDWVFGDLSAGGWGAFADFVCADADKLSGIPAELDFETAAAIPQAGVLALQALRDIRPVNPGDRVLINGAGGGVGCFAVQLAKRKGAHVTGVDTSQKAGVMLGWGADEVLDFSETDFTATGQKYDLIIDVVANRKSSDYLRCLTPTGALALVGGKTSTILSVAPHALRKSKAGAKRLGIVVYRVNRADQDELAALVAAGHLNVAIDCVLPMQSVKQAIETFASGRVKGKLVISSIM